MLSNEEAPVELGRLAGRAFEGVIFDMDGTLIDSTPAVVRAWTAWAEEYGLTADDLAGHHGVPAAGVVAAVLPEEQQAMALERINALELADMADVVVLPGAVDALAAVAEARSAIATSCTLPLALARIAAAELVPPSVVVTVDDVEHGKPAPDPFLEAARRMAVDPTRCLVVEDAPAGLRAADAAGCATLAVVTTNPREALRADAVVDTLAAVRFEVTPEGIRVRGAG